MDISRLVIVVRWEPRGGDAPLGWGYASYTVEIGGIPISVPTAHKRKADRLANKLIKRIEKYLSDGIV